MLTAAAALVTFALGGGSANALDAAKAQAITEAANSLIALAKDSARTGKPPRQTDPAAKPLLDLVFDVSELQAGTAFQMADFANLNAWQSAARKISGIYLLAGSGASDIAALPNDPKSAERVEQNMAEFAPELGRYIDAQLWIHAAQIDAVFSLVSTVSRNETDQPNIRNAIAQARTGLAESVTALVMMLANRRLDDNWRRERLAALAAVALRVPLLLLPEDARNLRDVALQIAGQSTDPAVKAGLVLFGATVGSMPAPTILPAAPSQAGSVPQPATAPQPAPTSQPVPLPAVSLSCAQAETHWKSAEEIKTLEAYQDHLARFPNCTFAALARARIQALKK
jgi:hypothetical protein